MEYNHTRVKENAKNLHNRNSSNSIGAGAITVLLGGAIGGALAAVVVFVTIMIVAVGGVITAATESEAYIIVSSILATVVYVVTLILAMSVSSLFNVGGLNWYRRSIREPGLSPTAVFDVFKTNRGKNIKFVLLKTLYLALWSLLYFPVFVKYYSYSMADFVIVEFPEVTPSRAIEISRTMTRGYKGQLFYLDLSFIGWMYLSALSMSILGIVYVNPYYLSAKAFAYEELKAIAIEKGLIPEFSKGVIVSE